MVKGHAVDARVGIDNRQLAIAVAAVLDIAQDSLGALRRLVIAHVPQVGGARLAPCQVSAGVNGRALQLALDMRQRVIDRVGRTKLRQRGNERARAAHAAHIVELIAGINVHTGVVHDHLGDGGI